MDLSQKIKSLGLDLTRHAALFWLDRWVFSSWSSCWLLLMFNLMLFLDLFGQLVVLVLIKSKQRKQTQKYTGWLSPSCWSRWRHGGHHHVDGPQASAYSPPSPRWSSSCDLKKKGWHSAILPPRAKEEAATINSTNHELLNNVGGNVSLEMQMPKLLWLSKHRPEVTIHLVVLMIWVIV